MSLSLSISPQEFNAIYAACREEYSGIIREDQIRIIRSPNGSGQVEIYTTQTRYDDEYCEYIDFMGWMSVGTVEDFCQLSSN